MLVEKNDPSGGGFNIGDTVKVRSTGQIGKIVGYNNGMWKISVGGSNTMVESFDLEHKQILLG